MIVKSGGGDVAVKSAFLDDVWPYPVIPPEMMSGVFAGGGSPFFPFMSIEQAMGLPALLGVLMRISTAIGMLPQKVYAGDQVDRAAATDTWQYDLLHERPGADHTPFTLKADIALSVAGAGYCPVRKYKVADRDVPGGQRVVDLMPLDPALCEPRRVKGRLIFEDRTESGPMVERTTDDIIFIRGPATGGGVRPLTPISLMREAIGTGQQRQAFEGAWYQNSAEARNILAFPEKMTPKQAMAWKEAWDDSHKGPANWHGTSVIGGGAQVTSVPISLADAEFVTSSRMTADQIGFVYGVPKVFMNTVDRPAITDQDWRYFVTFGLGWVIAAIDSAFTADRDLFPVGSKMRAETLVDALLKPDIATRYAAYLVARQAGWLSQNEIRALENYPPVEGGDVLQVTPVGAGVDNTGNPSGGPTPEPEPAKALEQLIEDFKAQGMTPAAQEILTRAIGRARVNGHELPALTA